MCAYVYLYIYNRYTHYSSQFFSLFFGHSVFPYFFPICFPHFAASRIFFPMFMPRVSSFFLPQSYAAFFFPVLLPFFYATCFFPMIFFHSFLPYVSYLLSIFVILHGFKYYALRTVARVQRKQAWTGGDDFLCLAQTYMKLYGITERSSLRSKLATQTSIKFWENGCWWQEISRNGCGMWDYPDVQKIDAVLLQYLRLCSQNLWNNCDTNKRVCLT